MHHYTPGPRTGGLCRGGNSPRAVHLKRGRDDGEAPAPGSRVSGEMISVGSSWSRQCEKPVGRPGNAGMWRDRVGALNCFGASLLATMKFDGRYALIMCHREEHSDDAT